jgi:hypothetical protein
LQIERKKIASTLTRRRSEGSRRTAYERIADAGSAVGIAELGASARGLETERGRLATEASSLTVQTVVRRLGHSRRFQIHGSAPQTTSDCC